MYSLDFPTIYSEQEGHRERQRAYLTHLSKWMTEQGPRGIVKYKPYKRSEVVEIQDRRRSEGRIPS